MSVLRKNMAVNASGHLQISGVDSVSLAKKYSTPLYVMDYDIIKANILAIKNTVDKYYPNNEVSFASKAFSCKAIYHIVSSFGLGADVVSGGELYTALQAGMSADKLYFHGNNKTNFELNMAVENNIHAVVIDSFYEINQLNSIAQNNNKIVNVLIRVNPGVQAHTHHFIQTAREDSKFGFSTSNGDALKAIEDILKAKNLKFLGIHCHIGSQIFETKPFELAVEKMTDFTLEIKNKLGYEILELSLGGGYGVRYTQEDKPLPLENYIKAICDRLNSCIKSKSIKPVKLVLEPGRCIVAEAGVTLYTIGAIKDIKDIKKYVSVDGGMFDNPRYALYQAKYDAVIANKANNQPTQTVTIAGKCCESSDMITEDCKIADAESGDILAVFCTGAYNYSMSSNYNRNAIPPVVLIKDKLSDYIVKPQSLEDISIRDNCPQLINTNGKESCC